MEESIILPPTFIRIEDANERAQTTQENNNAMTEYKSAILL